MGAAPSKSSTGHDAAKLLMLEVLGGQVGTREWRLGDWWSVGVLGLIRPYVVVKYAGQQHLTGVIEMPLGRREDCAANFDVHMALPMVESDASTQSASSGTDEVHITVRDRRFVQALIRGDPLVGEATLVLDLSASGLVNQRLSLRRRGEEVDAGWVNVQYRIVEAQSLRRILSMPAEHSLLDVVKAISDVLRTSDGVDKILAAKPVADVESVSSPKFEMPLLSDAAGREREAVRKFADKLGAVADSMSSGETAGDEDVLKCLESVAREILLFSAEFAGQEAPDATALALQWARNFFAAMAADPAGVRANPSLSRLTRLFQLVKVREEDLVPVDERGREVSVPGGWNPGEQVPGRSVLGQGSYGCVWRAMDRSTKQMYAVKKMPSSSGTAAIINGREVAVASHLRAVSHPCVVRLLDVLQHRGSRSLIMELCCHGDLQGKINASRRRGGAYAVPKKALAWSGQIFLGVEYLNSVVGMLIRDVKPQNVVLARGFRAKLTDFGMSRLAATSDGTYSFHPRVPPGSPHYVAPEVLIGCGYDTRADLYSLAVLVYVLLTGGVRDADDAQPPCAKMTKQGREGLMQLTKNWELLKAAIEQPDSEGAGPMPSDESKDFVLRLTDRSKGHLKLSHEDVRRHPFFRNVNLPPAGDGPATVEWLERSEGNGWLLEQSPASGASSK